MDADDQPTGSVHTGRIAASRKEEALWLLEKFVPDSGVNNLSMAFQADGELQRSVLQDVLDHLVRRHEVLRTVFHDDDGTLLRAVLGPGAGHVEVDKADSTAATPADDLTPFVARPFAADGHPLVRAIHLQRTDGDVFCVAVHHSIFDGTSSMVLLREAAQLYDAFATGDPAPGPLTDLVPAWTEPAPAERSAQFWNEQLAGFRSTDLDLWCEKPAASSTTLAGDVVNRPLSAGAKAVVRRLQRELRAPEAVVLLAAYQVLLAAHGAGPDLTVGTPVSLRDRDAVDALGYHINVLTIRTLLDADEPFRALVARTRRTFLTAMTYADHPVDDLLAQVPRSASSWRNLLFRHVFNYAPSSGPTEFPLAGGRAAQLIVENGSSKFDLEFFVTSTVDGLHVRAAYCTDVFDRADVEALVQRYEALLLALRRDHDRPVGELTVWSPADSATIGAANATTRQVWPPTVLDAVACSTTLRPEAVALSDGDRTVRYGQLWAAAVATAALLRRSGVAAGDVVALSGRRGPELAAAALGVWLAEAVYLPLDPDHPQQRTAYQLDDSGARAVLAGPGVTVPGDRLVLPMPAVSADSAEPEDLDLDPESCAYLIYTSGSTGRPKGTLISHASLANLIAHFARELGATESDSTLWLTTFSFDISALELFMPLATGGRIVVAPDEARTDGAALRAVLRGDDVGILQATPTTWRMVADEVAGELAGRRVLCGGEPLPPALAQRLAGAGARLRNVYGPTETTIWSTSGPVAPGTTRIDVGTPIANTQLLVADPGGRELPVGVAGELCIAGAGVALGYHGRPDLDAERFGTHPAYGRFYRTGDLARWLPDGRVEILGRVDRQIKLRGNRIELAEIESVLLEHPDVGGAAVVVVGDPSSDAVLVAFVVTRRPGVVEELWEHARGSLPLSAVPHDYLAVDGFPMTGNNKVDYPALTRLAADRRAAERPAATGERHDDELVDSLVELWRGLLDRPELDAGANFFASGGHSLLGAKLVQLAQRDHGVPLKLVDLFEHPDPVALAARIRALAPAA